MKALNVAHRAGLEVGKFNPPDGIDAEREREQTLEKRGRIITQVQNDGLRLQLPATGTGPTPGLLQ
ncbi:MAG: hypothetical protein CVU65_15665 [Deltaproteobacteria bacterium HGW-Deltaproteobacteria-22]|nr:MAG: hypothetical protein CVU65_15665 [Deltaproteobacteria bacterium HGW-Deltaproteobacteria-22]